MNSDISDIRRELTRLSSKIDSLSVASFYDISNSNAECISCEAPNPLLSDPHLVEKEGVQLKNQIVRLQDELNKVIKERDMWIHEYSKVTGQGCYPDNNMMMSTSLSPLNVSYVNGKSNTKKASFSLLVSNDNKCIQTSEGTTISTCHFAKTVIQLTWHSSVKSCLIIKKENDYVSDRYMLLIAEYLHSEQISVFVEPKVYEQIADKSLFKTWFTQTLPSLSSSIDFVITLGGDGTLLHLNSLFIHSVPPVLSFALGTLGFLTPFDVRLYKDTIHEIINEDINITLRTRLSCTFDDMVRNNTSDVSSQDTHKKARILPELESVPQSSDTPCYTVLNDIVLDRGDNCSMVYLECYIGDNHITTVHADGLIIATPTGSTAYSMAAGGSMVHPSVPAMLLTPICPHTLSFRQMILPDNVTLHVEVSMESRTNVRVSFDGRHQQTLEKGQAINISVSNYPLPSIQPSRTTKDWYTNVNESLNWNKQLSRKTQLLLHKSSTTF